MKTRIFLGLLLSFVVTLPAYAFKVGLLLDKGGKDDKSFNSAAVAGANSVKKEKDYELKIVETTDDNSYEPQMKNFANRGYDLVIAVGFSQGDALKKVAPQFPKTAFAIVDSQVDVSNVRSLLFEEHEGSFLVGAIAGLTTKTGKVGFVGGMDIPLIHRFQTAYEAGVKKVNPKAQVVSNYVGIDSSAWNNPPKGKELAVVQFNSGADISFAAAGASNTGVFDAAEEKKKLAIGVDSNQNWMKPGFILTSMLKRVDVSVANTIRDARDGKFTGGVVRYGLKNDGVGYAMDDFNKKLIPESVLKQVEELKKGILSGKIKVPDYYKLK